MTGRTPDQPPDDDPRGLIASAFGMDGLDEAECRAIFLDWVLGLQPDRDPRAAAAAVAGQHRNRHPGHPMHALLEAASKAPPAATHRRGGRNRRGPPANGHLD